MNSLKHHHRLSAHSAVEFEEWVIRLGVPLAFIAMGAALALGLLTSTGHVTW